MQTFDLSPLHRFAVGFDALDRLFDNLQHLDATAPSYPPYNIEKTGENTYRITMALAGFTEDDLSITVNDRVLVISGRKAETEPRGELMYRGIATRAFERRFQLADFIKVTDANLANGLLHVELVREVPEAMKPRSIAINGKGLKAIEADKQAA